MPARNHTVRRGLQFDVYSFVKSLFYLHDKITVPCSKDELLNLQIIAVVIFHPKQIANFASECPVPGVYDENKDVILVQSGKPVANGIKIG